MRLDEGTVTLWVLGLVMMMLAIGGIGLDLWRVLDTRRELGLLADSSAVAGASAIDEDILRSSGDIVLVPVAARNRALGVLAGSDPLDSVVVSIVGDKVSVEVRRTVDFTLLRFLLPDEGGILVEAVGAARPVSAP